MQDVLELFACEFSENIIIAIGTTFLKSEIEKENFFVCTADPQI